MAGESGEVALLDDRERVVERLGERRRVQAVGQQAAVDRGAGDDRVADAERGQPQRAREVLDLDVRLEPAAELLQALVELAAGRVGVAVVRVVEHERAVEQRRACATGCAARAGVGGRVEHLVADAPARCRALRRRPAARRGRPPACPRGWRRRPRRSSGRSAASRPAGGARASRPRGRSARRARRCAAGRTRRRRRAACGGRGRRRRRPGRSRAPARRTGAARVPAAVRISRRLRAREQRHAELGLQPPHLLGHRRLLEQQLVGRAGERAVVRGGEEVAELLQGHNEGSACARQWQEQDCAEARARRHHPGA